MDGLQLPLFPLGKDTNEYLLFLPGVEADEIEELGYEVEEEESIMQVYCIYDEDENGDPVGDIYPVSINEHNRPQIEQMEQLVVLGPDDMDPSELTEKSDDQEQLEELFETLRQMEEEQAAMQDAEIDPEQ
ncbi:MAG: hypothetical protein ABEJ65_09215 [bacterium]